MFPQVPFLNAFENLIANFNHLLGPALHNGSAALSEASVNLGLF